MEIQSVYSIASVDSAVYGLEHSLRFHGFRPNWLSRFLYPDWNFFNYLVAIINCTFTFCTINVFYFSSIIAQYAAFKLHMEGTNAQVSPSTIIILPTTVDTFHGLKCFSYVIYHYHVILLAWISLTLSGYSFLRSITSGKSSRLYPYRAERNKF